MHHALIGTSRGIAVRRFTASDVDVYREWLQPEQEWHRWDGPYSGTPSPDAIDAACAGLHAGLEDGTIGTESPARRAVIVQGADPERMLGTVSWHWESEESDWRRMGVTVFDPDVRGRGVGTEALRIWTDHLFASTEVRRLDFSTWSGNSRMLAVGRRLGFTEEARFRAAREVRGEVYDSVVMGVLRSEWAAATDHAALA